MRITVNETELYFDADGPELTVDGERLRSRPTFLVIHGGPGFDHGYLRPGLSPLADSAQVLYVDLRGQGRSAPVPIATCSLEQMADDVAALCRRLGLQEPIVFGHSAGGFVALHLALRHPSLPAGLILCHTAPTLAPLPDPDPPAGVAERGGPEAVAVAQRIFRGDLSPATAEAFNRLVLPLYAAPGSEHVPGPLMALSTMNADVCAHFFSRLAPRYDVRPRLSEIGVPSLVIVGRHDWVCPPAAGRVLATAIPDSRLVELDTGHFGFSETPQPFLRAVREHLARTAAVRGRLPGMVRDHGVGVAAA